MIKKCINKFKNMPQSAKAGIVFLICSFMQKGISTLTTPIFTRLLTTEEFGAYSIFVSWTSIFTIFITLKMAAGVLQQAYVKYSNEKNVLASSMQGLSTVFSLMAILIYLMSPNFWNNLTGMSSRMMIAMIVSIWATNIFEIWAQSQRTEYKYKALATLTVVTMILKPLSGIVGILLFPNAKVEARIYSLVIVEVLAYIGLYISQLKKGKFFSKKYWGYSIRYNIPLIPHYLSQQVLSQSDRLMVDYLCGKDEAGLYSLGYQIAMVMTLFNSAMSSTLNPWIYQCIKAKTYKKIEPTVTLLLRVLMALNIMLIIFAPEIVCIFAPASYAESVWAIPPVAMSCVFMFLYGVFVCFEFYYEKKKYIVYASVLGAVINVILNALLIPILGYVAASYTTLFCYMLFCMMHSVFMVKTCRDNQIDEKVFNYKKLCVELGCFMIVGFGVTMLYEYVAIRYMIVVVLLVYGLKQKERIKSVITSMRNKKG